MKKRQVFLIVHERDRDLQSEELAALLKSLYTGVIKDGPALVKELEVGPQQLNRLLQYTQGGK